MTGTGYARPIIRLDFTDELGSPGDPIWVVIRNPKLLPPKMLRVSKQAQAAAEALKDGGEDAGDADQALAATHAMAGRLVVAWRVYDPSPVPEIDPLTGEVNGNGGQVLLPSPTGGNGATAEQFGALPTAIQLAVMREITEALNPPQGPGAPTQKTSSSSQSPSTTEPGAEGRSQPN